MGSPRGVHDGIQIRDAADVEAAGAESAADAARPSRRSSAASGLTIPLTLAFVVFAVANRGAVLVSLWPFGIDIGLPLFLLVLGALAVGLVIGAFLTWVRLIAWKHRARARERRIAELEARLTEVSVPRTVTAIPIEPATLPAGRPS